MSENANKPEQSKPGKRLEQAAGKADLPLTPEEARAKKELRIMIIMIIAAVIMVIAASGVLLYNRWFKKPSLPPGPTQLGGDPSDKSGERKGEVCIVDHGKVCFCKVDYLKAAEAVLMFP